MSVKSPRSPLSLKDIAQEMGLSVMTVSYALRPRKPGERAICSEKTAERVRQAAEKLGYVPSRVARAMRTHQSGVIGFVAPHFSPEPGPEPYLAAHTRPFLTGIMQALSPSSRHVALVQLDELEIQQSGQLPIALRERFFDSLVIHFGLSGEAIRLIEAHGIPAIYWDSDIFTEHNCVNRNEFEAGLKVTRRLLELGHERIAFGVGLGSWKRYQAGERMHFSYGDRLDGFKTAMAERDLEPLLLEGYDPEDVGRQIRRGGITGVVLQTNNHLFMLQAAASIGKRIPSDISVLVCGLDPRLSVPGDLTGGAIYDRYETGQLVGRLLMERMDNHGVPVPSIRLPVDQIIDGGNAAAVPGAG